MSLELSPEQRAWLGKMVVHRSGAQQTGLVTAICVRERGIAYGVTWSDLSERWHDVGELTEWTSEDKRVGLFSK